MPDTRRSPGTAVGPFRHELAAVDEAALEAARAGDRLLAAAEASGNERWRSYLEPLPERLRDGDLRDLRAAAARSRSAYGPKDSIRDALPPEATEPFLEAIDRLLKVLRRRDALEDR
jgi:hypothetical protein